MLKKPFLNSGMAFSAIMAGLLKKLNSVADKMN